jgi:hypothetical protein
MPMASVTPQFQYFGWILLPADGMHAAVAHGTSARPAGGSRMRLHRVLACEEGAARCLLRTCESRRSTSFFGGKRTPRFKGATSACDRADVAGVRRSALPQPHSSQSSHPVVMCSGRSVLHPELRYDQRPSSGIAICMKGGPAVPCWRSHCRRCCCHRSSSLPRSRKRPTRYHCP